MLTGYRTRIAGAGAGAWEVSPLALGEGNAVVQLAVGDMGGGFGFDGARCMVGGGSAFRVAAHPNFDAAGVTGLLERFFPLHF
jgi:hypothetical protein